MTKQQKNQTTIRPNSFEPNNRSNLHSVNSFVDPGSNPPQDLFVFNLFNSQFYKLNNNKFEVDLTQLHRYVKVTTLMFFLCLVF